MESQEKERTKTLQSCYPLSASNTKRYKQYVECASVSIVLAVAPSDYTTSNNIFLIITVCVGHKLRIYSVNC